jgi:hypothetical protein
VTGGTQDGTVNLTNNGTANLTNFRGATLTNGGTATLNGSQFGSSTNSGNLSLKGTSVIAGLTNTGTLTQVSDTNTILDLDNQGSLVINGDVLRLSGSPKQSKAGASTTLNGGELVMWAHAVFQLQAGNLFGRASGSTIGGDISNTGGTIYAGGTTGTLEIVGNYTQGAGGTLNIGVDVGNGTNSSLKVDYSATLAGTLTVNWSDGTPATGSTWNVAMFVGGTGGTDFTTLTGTNGPGFTHVAGTWNPYTIKV